MIPGYKFCIPVANPGVPIWCFHLVFSTGVLIWCFKSGIPIWRSYNCKRKKVVRGQGSGNREQGTVNREQGTGNREQGTGKNGVLQKWGKVRYVC
jgi:hypothetical protein